MSWSINKRISLHIKSSVNIKLFYTVSPRSQYSDKMVLESSNNQLNSQFIYVMIDALYQIVNLNLV